MSVKDTRDNPEFPAKEGVAVSIRSVSILAVDPGKLTGWVYAKLNYNTVTRERTVDVLDWGENLQQEFCNIAWNLATTKGGFDYLVCESFIPRAGRVLTFEPMSLEIIGFLRWIMNNDPKHFTLQSPANAKAYATKEKHEPFRKGEKAVGRGGQGHAIDALSHLILFIDTNLIPRLEAESR